MNDDELHKAMAEISGSFIDGSGKCIELLPGWEKPLPFFGWFWRSFDWNRVPLGLGGEDGAPKYVGIMAKNKWYYPEYFCSSDESRVIRAHCEDIARGYSEEKVRSFTLYLQTLADKDSWSECDREAIDARTMQDFINGNYTFIQLK